MEKFTTAYGWANGSRMGKFNSQAVGEQCEALDQSGGLTPARLLDANRESGPLHEYFNWIDSEAAELYREGQAAHAIRSLIRVRVEGGAADPLPVCCRAFYRGDPVQVGRYEPLQAIIADPKKMDYQLQCALQDLRSFMLKYKKLEDLAELADVFSAISEALKESA